MTRQGLTAGIRYGFEAFSLGLVLGVIRTILIAPAIGALPAVLAELPIMLITMQFRARSIVGHMTNGTLPARAIMGSIGLLILLTCEFGLGLALGQTPRAWLAGLATAPGATGLAGQIVFALLPLFVTRSPAT